MRNKGGGGAGCVCPPQGRGASRGTHGQLQEPLDDPGIIHVLQGIGSRHPCPTVTREEGRQGPGCPGGGGLEMWEGGQLGRILALALGAGQLLPH